MIGSSAKALPIASSRRVRSRRVMLHHIAKCVCRTAESLDIYWAPHSVQMRSLPKGIINAHIVKTSTEGWQMECRPQRQGEVRLLFNKDFKALALSGLQEVQGLFPVVIRSASDGLEVVFRCL
eukprot:scaffold421237_cov62-Attheya_sp.AAC.1